MDRYLRGGDDWDLTDDEDWSKYMKNNKLLSQNLTYGVEPTYDEFGEPVRNGPVPTAAASVLNNYLATGKTDYSYDNTFPMEIENGEGIVGYQYLHGTDSNAGGFNLQGNGTVTPMADGTYEVRMDNRYTWNDTIDPNYQYDTDKSKNRLAEILTLGQADPYDIHISWQDPATITLDRSGNVVNMSGYPR